MGDPTVMRPHSCDLPASYAGLSDRDVYKSLVDLRRRIKNTILVCRTGEAGVPNYNRLVRSLRQEFSIRMAPKGGGKVMRTKLLGQPSSNWRGQGKVLATSVHAAESLRILVGECATRSGDIRPTDCHVFFSSRHEGSPVLTQRFDQKRGMNYPFISLGEWSHVLKMPKGLLWLHRKGIAAANPDLGIVTKVDKPYRDMDGVILSLCRIFLGIEVRRVIMTSGYVAKYEHRIGVGTSIEQAIAQIENQIIGEVEEVMSCRTK